MHAVDADAARRYAAEGFLCPVDALSREEAVRLRERLEDFERRAGATLVREGFALL